MRPAIGALVRTVLTPAQIGAVSAASLEPTPRSLIKIEREMTPLERAAALFLSMDVRGVADE